LKSDDFFVAKAKTEREARTLHIEKENKNRMKTTEHVLKAKTILAAKGEQTMEKIEAFMTEELKETYTGTKLESSEVE